MDTDQPDDLTEIGGVDGDTADSLRQAGYETPSDLHAASENDLVDIDGVSRPLAARIMATINDRDKRIDTDTDQQDSDQNDGTSPEQQEVENTAIDRSFLGLKWYHFVVVLLLSALYLESNLIRDITLWNILVALITTYSLVLGLTTLHGAFTD